MYGQGSHSMDGLSLPHGLRCQCTHGGELSTEASEEEEEKEVVGIFSYVVYKEGRYKYVYSINVRCSLYNVVDKVLKDI